MSPELLAGNMTFGSEASDIYAFAMTSLGVFHALLVYPKSHETQEIVTDLAPFSNLREGGIAPAVVSNKRPEKVEGIPPGLFELLANCWNGESAKRPRMIEVNILLYSIIEDF